MILAFTASLGMPFNINAIVESFDVSNRTAGLVVSLEMLAIAIGTLAIGASATRLSASRVYAIGLGIIVTLNVVSIAASGVWMLALARIPAGFALGAIVATVMATAARSDRPESTFGIINASVGAMGIVIAFVLPRALHLHDTLALPTQLSGLYLVYLGFSICAFVFLRFVPIAPSAAPGTTDAVRLPPRRWLSLLGLGMVFFGHALLGVFIVNLGRSIELEPESVGYVLMIGSVLGVAAPLIAGYVGGRVSAFSWVATLTVLIAVFAFALASAGSTFTFFIVAPIYGVLPMALIPVFLGALSRVDPTGRLAGAHPAFVLIGGAAAPFIGGTMSDAGGYLANAFAVALCALIGTLLMWVDLRASDTLRRATRGVDATSSTPS